MRGLDHIGITVRDIDEASDYLVAALGAEVMYDLFAPAGGADDPRVAITATDGTPSDQLLDLGDARISDAPPGLGFRGHRMLRLGDGATLELLQLDDPDLPDGRYAQLGINHLCVFVDDIEAAAQRIADAGGTLYDRFEMMGLEGGERAEAQYTTSPFGLRIELISYGRLAYEDLTPLRRTWAGVRGS